VIVKNVCVESNTEKSVSFLGRCYPLYEHLQVLLLSMLCYFEFFALKAYRICLVFLFCNINTQTRSYQMEYVSWLHIFSAEVLPQSCVSEMLTTWQLSTPSNVWHSLPQATTPNVRRQVIREC